MALQSGKPTAKKIEGPLFSLQVQFKFNILSSSSIYSVQVQDTGRSVHSDQIQVLFQFIPSNSVQIHSIQIQFNFKFIQFKFNTRHVLHHRSRADI